jgi:hypothetical protein
VRAARRLRIGQPDVSKRVNGRLAGFSVERLREFLNALDVDVDIVVRPRQRGRRSGPGVVRVVEAVWVLRLGEGTGRTRGSFLRVFWAAVGRSMCFTRRDEEAKGLRGAGEALSHSTGAARESVAAWCVIALPSPNFASSVLRVKPWTGTPGENPGSGVDRRSDTPRRSRRRSRSNDAPALQAPWALWHTRASPAELLKLHSVWTRRKRSTRMRAFLTPTELPMGEGGADAHIWDGR